MQRIVDDLWSNGPIPRFGTHVICRLTVKFNHHRVKVIICTCFVLPIYTFKQFQTIQMKEKSNRTRALFSVLSRCRTHWSAHTQRERHDSDTVFQTTPQRMDADTQSYVKIPVLASILVNHSRLCLKLTYTAEKETRYVSVLMQSAAQIWSEFQNTHMIGTHAAPALLSIGMNDCCLSFVRDSGRRL